MIPTLLFVAFIAMMLAGVPIGASLGLAGAACIALANADAQWFGLLAVPQNFYAGLGKYPLLAIPMFVLFALIAVLSCRVVWDDFRFEETSPGIGIPQWWYTVWLPVLSTAIAGRALGLFIRRGREQ